MKKLLFILSVLFVTLALNAQQTEDEVYIGKKYGNYKGTGIIIPDTDRPVKPGNSQITLTGVVVSTGKLTCAGTRCTAISVSVKKDDGTVVTIGTKDYNFTLPKEIKGRRITVEGITTTALTRERRFFQNEVQLAATGIIVVI